MHKVYFNTLHCTTKYYKNLSNLNAPRREPQFFAVTFNRLWNSDKSISYIVPKLYNKTANIINKDIKYSTTCLQDKFLNSTVNKHFLTAQYWVVHKTFFIPNNQESMLISCSIGQLSTKKIWGSNSTGNSWHRHLSRMKRTGTIQISNCYLGTKYDYLRAFLQCYRYREISLSFTR